MFQVKFFGPVDASLRLRDQVLPAQFYTDKQLCWQDADVALHPDDRAALATKLAQASAGMTKPGASPGMPLALQQLLNGRTPFVTWHDPLTNMPVGAFYTQSSSMLCIKPWDPYTASDLWNDIKGALCPVLTSPAAMVGAAGAGAAAGLSPATVAAIAAAASVLCPTATPTTPAPGQETTMYPEGTIHTLENGQYRIAIPIGTASAAAAQAPKTVSKTGMTLRRDLVTQQSTASLFGYVPQLLGPMPQLLGPATHEEIQNTEPSVDPATRGSRFVTPAEFGEMTGSAKPLYKQLWFWGAVAGGVAILGGGVYVIRKRRGRRSR